MAENTPNTTAHTTPMKLIKKPHVTEKSQTATTRVLPVYTFEIGPNVNKTQVVAEVKRQFKVTPVKVRTVTLPRKRVFVRGKWGMKAGMKKALVFLKKGDKIEFA